MLNIIKNKNLHSVKVALNKGSVATEESVKFALSLQLHSIARALFLDKTYGGGDKYFNELFF